MAPLLYNVVPTQLAEKNWACLPEPSARRFAKLLEEACARELAAMDLGGSWWDEGGTPVRVEIREDGPMGCVCDALSLDQRVRAKGLIDAIANAVRQTGDWVVFDDAVRLSTDDAVRSSTDSESLDR